MEAIDWFRDGRTVSLMGAPTTLPRQLTDK